MLSDDLLAEIREISEKKRNEDEILHCIVEGNTLPICPHYEFEYPDSSIHQGLYQLAKYSCRRFCSTDELDKVMNVWKTLLEPMIGLPYGPQTTMDNEAFSNASNVESALSAVGVITSAPSEASNEGGREMGPGESLSSSEVHRNHVNTFVNDRKAENEGEIEGMADSHDFRRDAVLLSDHAIKTLKPLNEHVPQDIIYQEEDCRVFYGNDSFYLLFRLHQILYERLKKATEFFDELMRGDSNGSATTDSYARFMSSIFNTLDGCMGNTTFRNKYLVIVSNWSYPQFSMDYLFLELSKALFDISSDGLENQLLQLHAYEKTRQPWRFLDIVYFKNASGLILDDNIYRIESLSTPSRVTIQLLDYGKNKPEMDPIAMHPNFVDYLQWDLLSVVPKIENTGIFLNRNKRKYECEDEDYAMAQAMEGLKFVNGLICKIACDTSKMSFVLGSEDFLMRMGRKRTTYCQNTLSIELASTSNGQSPRVKQFRKLVSDHYNANK